MHTTTSVTVTPELNRLLKRDTAHALMLRPRVLVLPLLIVLLPMAAALGALALGAPASGHLCTAVVVLGAFGFLIWRQLRRVSRLVDTAFPVGCTPSARVSPEGLHLGSATGLSLIAPGVLRDAHVHGSVLILRQRASNIRLIHPAALFSDDDLAQLRQQMT